MLTAIEVFPDGDAMTATKVRIVFRGTLVGAGTPFVTEIDDVDLEDVASTVSAELVDNSVEWGVYNDVS